MTAEQHATFDWCPAGHHTGIT